MTSKRQRVYVYRGVCDMRRSYDQLARMVEEQLGRDPRNGNVYVFMNRSSDRMKALSWEQNGYVIWSKRLEEGSFEMPGGGGLAITRRTWQRMKRKA